jgi:alpha-amylase/alpha-mannosidase (GH57 family)
MPRIHLCFLWHMHQPFYKDLVSGEYKLPWTRLHALKDYYGMVQILEEFPRVRQTFNLVPSMMVQVQEYAAGEALDPFLEVAVKPAHELSETEQEFLLQHSFYPNPQRMIFRYPRYGELYQKWETRRNGGRVRQPFTVQDLRDLQLLSQLCWFDEELQARDPEVRELLARGRGYSLADQKLMAAKQREIIGMVLPAYQRMAAARQIEISTTPYYHPILPLLCDSQIAAAAHPGVRLPPRFRYPQDARRQLELARGYVEREFGVAPAGLWPSEGSVSDEVFATAAECGFQWTATDSAVLARTLGRHIGVEQIYRPYRWRQDGREIGVVFRDHLLSDLIGFVYSRMDARAAAADFLHRIRENCRGILSSGRDALVPIILDGENAWEYYEQNGRPFLRDLYRRISEDDQMVATTLCEAFSRLDAEPLSHIFPGSWINANFDVWIGAEEDNQAWTHLLHARQAYDTAVDVAEEGKKLAYEELLIAEGSDWCWWYGPEHDSANRAEFDQLYRAHLANVYRALGRTPPEELSRPILRMVLGEVRLPPSGAVRPVIDGEISSYFEWLGAGMYRVDQRSGSMHGKKFLVEEVWYGTDGAHLSVRVDFHRGSEADLPAIEARLSVRAGEPEQASSASIRFDRGKAQAVEVRLAAPDADPEPIACAFQRVLEVRIALAALGAAAGRPLRFQISLWQGGLPMDSAPHQGWIELPTTEPAEWME